MSPNEKLREILDSHGFLVDPLGNSAERVARAFAKWALEEQAQEFDKMAADEGYNQETRWAFEGAAENCRERAAQIGGDE